MIAVVDYGSGNLRSVAKAFEAIGAEVQVTSNPSDLRHAERIVLPGVGSFAEGMRSLRERGLIEALEAEVLGKRKPFMGICLGMQMLAEEGTEDGLHPGLAWVGGRVVPLVPADRALKVPHMGWNEVERRSSPFELFSRLPAKPIFYFAHSFRFDVLDATDIVRTPPPTVNGIKHAFATCATTSRRMSRPSWLVVISRKTSSSAPCAS